GGVVGAARSDMFFHATLARSFINALSLRGDDDVIDRLNYYYTPIMLSIACLIISAKQVIIQPPVYDDTQKARRSLMYTSFDVNYQEY
ncbi:hypothetical protein ANCDUO_11329, partial [Ancylostoma duodenale]